MLWPELKWVEMKSNWNQETLITFLPMGGQIPLVLSLNMRMWLLTCSKHPNYIKFNVCQAHQIRTVLIRIYCCVPTSINAKSNLLSVYFRMNAQPAMLPALAVFPTKRMQCLRTYLRRTTTYNWRWIVVGKEWMCIKKSRSRRIASQYLFQTRWMQLAGVPGLMRQHELTRSWVIWARHLYSSTEKVA